jgi:hypothetical protein
LFLAEKIRGGGGKSDTARSPTAELLELSHNASHDGASAESGSQNPDSVANNTVQKFTNSVRKGTKFIYESKLVGSTQQFEFCLKRNDQDDNELLKVTVPVCSKRDSNEFQENAVEIGALDNGMKMYLVVFLDDANANKLASVIFYGDNESCISAEFYYNKKNWMLLRTHEYLVKRKHITIWTGRYYNADTKQNKFPYGADSAENE